ANPTEQRLAEAWAAVLRVPVESIGRRDNFFDRGGTSLAAVRLVASVDRLFTLTDLTRTPVLADLAAHVDGATAARRPALLRRLDAASDGEPARHVLVCFPPAGADPLYFLPLAKELADRGVAVYGVASPGHDTDVAEPFVGVAQLGAAVAAEVAAQGWSSVALWGQAAGSAAAVATARKMAVDGREPAHLFVGEQLLEPVAALRRHHEAAAAVSDAKVAARLGVSEVLAADPVRVARLGAAYRHDATAANSYFIGVWRNPTLPRLHTRLTLVVGRDDPATAASSRDLGWDLVAGSVAVRELPDGGPDFLTHRPGEVAELVLAAVQEPVDVVPAAAQSVVSPSA
ncbi:MAG TPA: thioesterase domain-containing protein, partial [Micromonospora sp.]